MARVKDADVAPTKVGEHIQEPRLVGTARGVNQKGGVAMEQGSASRAEQTDGIRGVAVRRDHLEFLVPEKDTVALAQQAVHFSASSYRGTDFGVERGTNARQQFGVIVVGMGQ